MFRRVTIGGGALLALAVLAAAGFVLFRAPSPANPVAASRGVLGVSGSSGTARAGDGAGPGLVWKVLSVSTARRIDNAYLPAQAHGTFLILEVREQAADPQTGSLDVPTLELGGASYAVDQAAQSALELAGHPVLGSDELGAEVTATGWIAFDVPPSALSGPAKLCGGTSACVAVARPSSSAT